MTEARIDGWVPSRSLCGPWRASAICLAILTQHRITLTTMGSYQLHPQNNTLGNRSLSRRRRSIISSPLIYRRPFKLNTFFHCIITSSLLITTDAAFSHRETLFEIPIQALFGPKALEPEPFPSSRV
ncbi:uncharacterized protein BDZ99DRAFT_194759 [Mytilinidion resinicola]|uniref:Uncharacterized protein n=1 Tax=Mytilinidion resinicola TaxID=574789 RepID=A0A6A6Z3Z9_9PEZI|nr:uncharacterized protein BDZ99DRAFT_194759 [Mytilinidion resinicola]KAF2815373.1 hypothetical protein BDZ99DRAFT_194759 [Mytilinidion resinicola]